MLGRGFNLKELFNYSHVTKHIASLPPLVAVSREEIQEQSKEAYTDVNEVVPEGTCVASGSLKMVGGEVGPGEDVL